MTDAVNHPGSPEQIARRIGPYEITREIGRGGMGVVYLARDTKLDRDVAIKCLPEDLLGDADRLARFEREAKLLASLNHPNIATVHGLEEVDGKRYLILEYIEGETLEQLLQRGPIAVAEALLIAKQIAEAIESAHEKGVIHRDLKPANIKFTASGGEGGQVKVLDFGLARTLDDQSHTESEIANSPTIVEHSPTMPGVVLGTAGYLSPEQARGKAADKRTDIFSFGCILYEMLTGRTPFAGETTTDCIGAALHKDPDWERLPPDLPPTIHLLLRRCLVKDKLQRLQDIGNARVEIQDVSDGDPASSLLLTMAARGTGSVQRRFSRAILGVTGTLAIVAIIVGVWSLNMRVSDPIVTRLTISLPFGYELTSAPAISPDGQLVAYTAWHDEDESGLFVRALNEYGHRLLVESDKPAYPFFSPNGLHIGYFDDNQLWRVDVSGGAPTALAPTPIPFGGTWGPKGDIVYTPSLNSGLFRIDASGGTPEQITVPDYADAGYAHTWPQYDDAGESLIFAIWGAGEQAAGRLWIKSLQWEKVYPILNYASLAGSEYLLHSDAEGALRAVPLNTNVPPHRKESRPVMTDRIQRSYAGDDVWYDLSANGTLIYVPTSSFKHRLTWFDRQSKEAVEVMEEEAAEIALSPNGEKVLYTSRGSLWMYDLKRNTPTQIEPQTRIFTPEWSPDGDRIYFSWNRSGDWDLYARETASTAPATRLLERPYGQHISDIAKDGTIAFFQTDPDSDTTVWVISPGEEPRLLLDATFGASRLRFSPEKDLLAYTVASPPYAEVFLVTYPQLTQPIQVSSNGGQEPLWSPDGKELFYRKGDDIMVVSVTMDDKLSVGEPSVVLRDLSIAKTWANYRLSPDGKRFLVLQRDPDAVPRQINVILDWAKEFNETMARENN